MARRVAREGGSRFPVTMNEGRATLSEGGSSCRASGLLERSLCGQAGYVTSSQSVPRIQPFLDLERHIILSSQTRIAQA